MEKQQPGRQPVYHADTRVYIRLPSTQGLLNPDRHRNIVRDGLSWYIQQDQRRAIFKLLR